MLWIISDTIEYGSFSSPAFSEPKGLNPFMISNGVVYRVFENILLYRLCFC